MSPTGILDVRKTVTFSRLPYPAIIAGPILTGLCSFIKLCQKPLNTFSKVVFCMPWWHNLVLRQIANLVSARISRFKSGPRRIIFNMKIEKKIWPVHFEKILKGEKKFEVRLADFSCNPGDVLVLREWNPETKEYTGRIIEKTVTCISKTKDAKFWSKEEIEKYGFQIIGFN